MELYDQAQYQDRWEIIIMPLETMFVHKGCGSSFFILRVVASCLPDTNQEWKMHCAALTLDGSDAGLALCVHLFWDKI